MNVFNPENIQVGDKVKLANDENAKPMIVVAISGKNENKIYCQELRREFFASCFKLVAKGN